MEIGDEVECTTPTGTTLVSSVIWDQKWIKINNRNMEKQNEVSFTDSMTKLLANAKTSLIAETGLDEKRLTDLEQTYQKLVVTDMASYKFVTEGIKIVAKSRTSFVKSSQELRKPVTKFGKDLIDFEKENVARLEKIETYLDTEKTKFDDLQAEEDRKKFGETLLKITEAGWVLMGDIYVCGINQLAADKIRSFEDGDLDFYVDLGEKEKTRKAAELELQSKTLKELEDTRSELAEMKRLIAELKGEKIEIEIQAEALDVAYEEPAPVAVVEEVVSESELVINYFQPQEKGFEEFRTRILEKLASPDKFTRESLVFWVNEQKLV